MRNRFITNQLRKIEYKKVFSQLAFINIFILFSLTCIPANAVKINFKYQPGTKYKAEATINGTQYVNGIVSNNYKQYYKIVTTVNSVDKNGVASLLDDGYYYIDNSKSTGIMEIKDNVLTEYHKDRNGITFASAVKPFPVMRNVPYLPDDDLTTDSKWDFSGIEVQEFLHNGVISRLPIEVNYTLKSVANDGEQTAVIDYKGVVDLTNDFSGSIDDRIVAIYGVSSNTLYFSITQGVVLKEVYNRDYQLLMHDRMTGEQFIVGFRDSGERIWTPVVIEDTKNIIKELKEDIKENKIDDVEIVKDNKGIKLSLENIQFEPDSAILTEKEGTRLDKIAGILAKYKDKPKLIIGHTTDRGTEDGRKKLSTQRAKTVADYLLNKNAASPDTTQYMGKGGTEPVAPNTTLEGMKKNRRVEIYLLEE